MARISIPSVANIARSVDQNIGIGKKTAEVLRDSAEDYVKRISEMAVSMATNANRSTILIQDIESAKEQLIKGITFVESHLPD